ncbi:MAG: type II toxin-antitoxin system RelB/DinJ family antitoxin [Acidobacteriaceae bacterium]
MATNALVQVRINGQIKAEAAAVLAEIDLTVSEAVRLMLIRVAKDRALPFDPWQPNAATHRAMLEAEQIVETRSARYQTPDALFNALYPATRP